MATRVVFAMLAVVAASDQATVDAQRVCTREAQPVHYRGDSFHDAGALPPDECQAYCARNSTCVAYTFAPRPNLCFTYQTIRTPAMLSSHDLGLSKLVSGRCGAQLPQVNGDFRGNDLTNVPSPNVVQCSYACEDTTGCFAYTWSTFNGGTCWMKTDSSTVSGPSDGSAVSGEVFKCEYYTHFEVAGEDLSSVERSNWRDCCKVCRQTTGCKASSWTDFNGGTCWLKKTSSPLTNKMGVKFLAVV